MLKGLNPSAYIPDFLRSLGFESHFAMYVFGNAVITQTNESKLTKKQRTHIADKYTEWRKHIDEEPEEPDSEEPEEPANKKSKNVDCQ